MTASALALGLTLGLATLLRRWIELPCRRLLLDHGSPSLGQSGPLLGRG
jgi:hypothetical protein